MSLYGKYFKKYKIPFFISVGSVALEGICDLLVPTLMSKIINFGIYEKSLPNVYRWGALMLLVTALGAIFAIIRNNLSCTVSQRVGADLRYDLFKKIMCFSEQSFDKIESGSLVTRMTNDTNQIVQFVTSIMRVYVKAPVMCIGSIVLASILNFRLSLIIYSVVAIVALLITISVKLSQPRYSKLQTALDKVNSIVQEYLIGVRLVKAFGTYDQESDKFEDANQNLMQKGVSAQMVITLIAPLISLTVGIGTVLVILIGSKLFSVNMANLGDITAFTIYMAQILSSLLLVTYIFNAFIRAKTSTTRIQEVLECKEDFASSGKTEELGGEIDFQNVTFAYPTGSGVPAIKDLSFSAKSGERLAIIGPTGSGKSTIAWLLLRFYDADSGRILMGGCDLKNLGVDSIRNNVAIVPQKPMLFSGSVAENIRWGDGQADDEMLCMAAQKAQAGFIDDMSNGFESILGSGGVNISGGQKQRISIARGILKNSPILILDDATSALDAVTEAKVRENLYSDARDQTIITITQRCGTAMFADRILVMDNGSKVGYGTHEQLMENCEVYRDIYKTQIESKEA